MSKERILWVDWLKFLAIVGVIGIHTSSVMLNSELIFTSGWYQGVIVASTFRFAIVLFIMISGYLLLRKQQPIEVVPKRIKRIILPFIFWLIIYAIIKIVVKGDLGPGWTFFDLIGFILKGFIDPMGISVQFWYVYMLIGLYLLSPMLSRWIENAPIKEVEYTLIIWAILSLVEFFGGKFLLMNYLRFFTGAIGYFILGYYLTVKDSSLLENKSFGLILFVTGSLFTIIGTVGLSLLTNDQSLFFIKLGDITPGACLQGIGLFVMIKNTDLSRLKPQINEFVTKISKHSYGIYLINVLVINLLNKLHIFNMQEWTLIQIFMEMFLTLLLSELIIRIMSKTRFLKLFAGN